MDNPLYGPSRQQLVSDNANLRSYSNGLDDAFGVLQERHWAAINLICRAHNCSIDEARVLIYREWEAEWTRKNVKKQKL